MLTYHLLRSPTLLRFADYRRSAFNPRAVDLPLLIQELAAWRLSQRWARRPRVCIFRVATFRSGTSNLVNSGMLHYGAALAFDANTAKWCRSQICDALRSSNCGRRIWSYWRRNAMPASVAGDSIEEAWEKSLLLFGNALTLNRFDSERGPCIELEDVTIRSASPACEPRSTVYPESFRPFIEIYSDGFFGQNVTEASTIAERLYRWPKRSSKKNAPALDQIAHAGKVLREKPGSRYNIVSFWDPNTDTRIANPVSPLVASFRVRSGRLNSTLCVRSIDAWLGALPVFVGFARLHSQLAQETACHAGFLTFFVLSYHLYEMDLMVIPELGGA